MISVPVPKTSWHVAIPDMNIFTFSSSRVTGLDARVEHDNLDWRKGKVEEWSPLARVWRFLMDCMMKQGT